MSQTARTTVTEIVARFAPETSVVSVPTTEQGDLAIVTAVDLAGPDGTIETLALRQMGDANLAAEPHAAMNEVRVLRALGRRGMPVAQVRHVDESGTLLARSFVVLTWVDGTPDYDPCRPDRCGPTDGGLPRGTAHDRCRRR